MMKIRLDIETISTVTLQSSQQQVALQDNFLSGLAAVDERIARVEEMLREQADQVQASQFKQVGSSYDMSTTRKIRAPPKKELYTTTTRSEGMGVRVTPFVVTCRAGCPCACHLQQKSSSPALLNRVLGRLFVGYAGLPLFSPKCNSSACKSSRASQVSLEY